MEAATLTEAKRLCGAKNRSGGTCGNTAGKGTNHLGWGQCANHLGNTPSGIRFAEQQRAIAEGRRYITEREVDPLEAILSGVRLAAGIRDSYMTELGQVPPEDDEKFERLRIELRRSNRELVQAGKAAVDAGVAERLVQLHERIAGALSAAVEVLLAQFVSKMLGRPLTDDERRTAVAIVVGRLETFEGEAEDITPTLPERTAA
jgi:hypothetical protein